MASHFIGTPLKQFHETGSFGAIVVGFGIRENVVPEVYDRVNIHGLRFDYVRARDHLRDALVRTFLLERCPCRHNVSCRRPEAGFRIPLDPPES
jgi:hypothetical protein